MARMLKAERERRAEVLTHATREGYWSGRGDECAIRCKGCDMPMLILAKQDAPPEEGGVRGGVTCSQRCMEEARKA